MKKIGTFRLFAAAAFAAILGAACDNMLETSYNGDRIPEDQKNEVLEANPALVDADANSMYAIMVAYQAGSSDWRTGTYHNDFGMPAFAIMTESGGQDFYSPLGKMGYNWFGRHEIYTARAYNDAYTRMIWCLFYKQIRAANALCASVPAQSESAVLRAYRGQALAFRAFNYWNLAQMYQYSYNVPENRSKPCVPIVTEETLDGDNPRKSVQEVYDQILSDLNSAISLLEGFERANKGQIDQSVAYGLRARTYLVMGEYDKAAQDAARALELSGAAPYSLQDVSTPTFNTSAHNSVMWAALVSPQNDVVESGIINWPSHLCSFTGNGYVSVGAVRCISKTLYEQIPASDVRKGWWLDENSASPLVAGAEYNAWRASLESYIEPYLNVKFGMYENKPLSTINASDWTLMRAEEMLLIKAEGLAMNGDIAGGKQALEDFVKTYRNPQYSVSASSAQELQHAVWMQRRIELWGEGFAWFDLMRLHKPVIRIGSSWHADCTFNIAADAPILLWMIPQAETEANHAITHPADNNPIANTPTPGEGEDIRE
jgi:tetratricopeptide (TPR) repeat protein